MKELCIDARMSMNSGIGTYIRNIVKHLKNGPFKVKLILHPHLLDLWPEAHSMDLILTSAPIYSMEEQIKLPFLIPKCDIFWSPHYNVPLLPIRAKKRVVTLHDVNHLFFAKKLPIHKKYYAKIVIRSATQLSDCIITSSTFSKEEIIKFTKAKKEKIEVIYHGIDRSHFKSNFEPEYLKTIQIKYNLPSKFFLFVGTLAPHKNIARLLKAWNILSNTHPDWHLVLVGKQTNDVEWKQVILQNPSLKEKIHFLGQINDLDLPGIYHLGFATILPSLYEGFGLTPLESISCATPIILSNVTSLPEIYGSSAIYIDPYNESDIAQKIEKMILDSKSYSQLKQIGIEKSQQFSWESSVTKHIHLLTRLS